MAKRVRSVKVCGGLGTDLAKGASSAVKKVFDILFKSLDKFLTQDGFEVKETKDIKKDGHEGKQIKYEVGDKGDIVTVNLFVMKDDTDKFIIEISAKGCKPYRKENVTKDKIMKYVTDYADKNGLGSVEGEIGASKVLQVSLKRVCGSKEDTINLTAICANYPVVEAMGDLNSVLDSAEFTDSITPEGASFEITQNDDEFDVQEIEEVDASSCYRDMLISTISSLYAIQAIHWGAKGDNFQQLHNRTDNMIWSFKNYLDTIAEWMVEQTKVVPYIKDLELPDLDIDFSQGFTLEEGTEVLMDILHSHLEVLEIHYVNLPHDIQSVVDNWIREIKKEVDYFMERTVNA